MSNRYTDAIRRLKKQIKPVADQYRVSGFILWADALFAHVRYGVTPNQYIGYRFYEKNGIARKMFYTERQQDKFERMLNASEFSDYFWNKAKFNALFSDFVKRDWLECVAGGVLKLNNL